MPGGPPQRGALAALNKHEDVSQRQLVHECHLEGPTITRHLDLLEALGLVRRQPDRRDRRSSRSRSPPKGSGTTPPLSIAKEVDDSLLDLLAPHEHEGTTELSTGSLLVCVPSIAQEIVSSEKWMPLRLFHKKVLAEQICRDRTPVISAS